MFAHVPSSGDSGLSKQEEIDQLLLAHTPFDRKWDDIGLNIVLAFISGIALIICCVGIPGCWAILDGDAQRDWENEQLQYAVWQSLASGEVVGLDDQRAVTMKSVFLTAKDARSANRALSDAEAEWIFSLLNGIAFKSVVLADRETAIAFLNGVDGTEIPEKFESEPAKPEERSIPWMWLIIISGAIAVTSSIIIYFSYEHVKAKHLRKLRQKYESLAPALRSAYLTGIKTKLKMLALIEEAPTEDKETKKSLMTRVDEVIKSIDATFEEQSKRDKQARLVRLAEIGAEISAMMAEVEGQMRFALEETELEGEKAAIAQA